MVAFIAQLSHNATSMKSSPCPRYTQSSRSTLAESTEVIHTHPLIPNCFDEIDHSNSSTSELLDNAVAGDGLAYKGREVLHKAPIEGCEPWQVNGARSVSSQSHDGVNLAHDSQKES